MEEHNCYADGRGHRRASAAFARPGGLPVVEGSLTGMPVLAWATAKVAGQGVRWNIGRSDAMMGGRRRRRAGRVLAWDSTTVRSWPYSPCHGVYQGNEISVACACMRIGRACITIIKWSRHHTMTLISHVSSIWCA
jgi:hypothetical protein